MGVDLGLSARLFHERDPAATVDLALEGFAELSRYARAQ
jgi:hypothetical protein